MSSIAQNSNCDTHFRLELAELAINNGFSFKDINKAYARDFLASKHGLTNSQGAAIQAWFAIYPTTFIESLRSEKFSFSSEQRKLWNSTIVGALLKYYKASYISVEEKLDVTSKFIHDVAGKFEGISLEKEVVNEAFENASKAIFGCIDQSRQAKSFAEYQTNLSQVRFVNFPIDPLGVSEDFKSAHLASLEKALSRSFDEVVSHIVETDLNSLDSISSTTFRKLLQPFNGFYNIVSAFLNPFDIAVMSTASLYGALGFNDDMISKIANTPVSRVHQSTQKLQTMGLLHTKTRSIDGMHTYLVHSGFCVGILAFLCRDVPFTQSIRRLIGDAIIIYKSKPDITKTET